VKRHKNKKQVRSAPQQRVKRLAKAGCATYLPRGVRMKEFFKKVGITIAQKRYEQGLSQERLAELAGIHRNQIGYIERAEKRVKIETLFKIANALDINMKEFFKE